MKRLTIAPLALVVMTAACSIEPETADLRQAEDGDEIPVAAAFDLSGLGLLDSGVVSATIELKCDRKTITLKTGVVNTETLRAPFKCSYIYLSSFTYEGIAMANNAKSSLSAELKNGANVISGTMVAGVGSYNSNVEGDNSAQIVFEPFFADSSSYGKGAAMEIKAKVLHNVKRAACPAFSTGAKLNLADVPCVVGSYSAGSNAVTPVLTVSSVASTKITASMADITPSADDDKLATGVLTLTCSSCDFLSYDGTTVGALDGSATITRLVTLQRVTFGLETFAEFYLNVSADVLGADGATSTAVYDGPVRFKEIETVE